MFCSPTCGEGRGLGPEHPSANIPGIQSLDPLWWWWGAEPSGDPPVLPAPCSAACLALLYPLLASCCPVRRELLSRSFLPSWAAAVRLCRDNPFPWHQRPPAFSPALLPVAPSLGGAQSLRRAEELGCSGMLSAGMFPEASLREAPMGPPSLLREVPVSPVARPLPCPSPFLSSGKLSGLPASPSSFRLLPPRLRSPVPFFPPLIHK